MSDLIEYRGLWDQLFSFKPAMKQIGKSVKDCSHQSFYLGSIMIFPKEYDIHVIIYWVLLLL